MGIRYDALPVTEPGRGRRPDLVGVPDRPEIDVPRRAPRVLTAARAGSARAICRR